MFTPASSVSPTIPAQITSGTSTINRTLLHHQQPEGRVNIPTPGNHQSATLHGRNGSTGNSGMRGSGYSGDSPPPDYNIVVHGNRHGLIFYYFFLFIILFITKITFILLKNSPNHILFLFKSSSRHFNFSFVAVVLKITVA